MTEEMKNDNGMLIWIAIGISVLALVFSVLAYNRTGRQLQQVAQEEIQEAEEEVDLTEMRDEAAEELEQARDAVETDEAYEEAADQVAEARVELELAYNDASIEAQQEWSELNSEFENVEAELRDGSADALASLEALITDLRVDMRTDEE